jgi:hypothetical protein
MSISTQASISNRPPISSEPRPPLTTTNVLIVDDHDLVAMSLALYLRSEGLLAQRHAARSRDGIHPQSLYRTELHHSAGRDRRGTSIQRPAMNRSSPADRYWCAVMAAASGARGQV